MKAAFEALLWMLFCLYAWRLNRKYAWVEEASLIGFWDALSEVTHHDPKSMIYDPKYKKESR